VIILPLLLALVARLLVRCLSLGHRGLVALREPHGQAEPLRVALPSMACLVRPHVALAPLPRPRQIGAGKDLVFRRASGEQGRGVIDERQIGRQRYNVLLE
jgi:hypothetical protein